MPEVGDPSYDRDSACFLMVPYSNRIENSRFRFLDKTYQLDNADQHAIHGDVRKRSWHIEESSVERVVFGFDSSRYENINWPWPFAAHAEYRIRDHTFSATLTLCNRSSESMPAGMGWHPFFNRSLYSGEEEVRLCFKTPFVYPDANDNRIPSGPPRAAHPEEDFTYETVLPVDRDIDACYRGYDGGGYIRWPKSRVRLDFHCSSCSHLIVFNPASRPYFAVEPVTHANNGVNLLDGGDEGCGVCVLQPGEALEAQFSLTVVVG